LRAHVLTTARPQQLKIVQRPPLAIGAGRALPAGRQHARPIRAAGWAPRRARAQPRAAALGRPRAEARRASTRSRPARSRT